jgi:hypothetical protein
VTQKAERWIDRNMARLTMLCVGGTCLCFVGFGYLLVQNRANASQGAKARVTQMQRQPTFEKLLRWAATDPTSGITQDDLTCFRSGRRCPPAPTRTP